MDEDLRELERAAARGEPGARRALLVARRRGGLLDEERLAHAAALGDEDARALLGDAAPPEAPDVMTWLEALRGAPWARDAALQAAVAGARVALQVFEREHPEDRGPRGCVEAAEALLACPCPEHAAVARRRGEWQERANVERARRTRGRWPVATVAERAVLYAALACGRYESSERALSIARLAVADATAAVRADVRAAVVRAVGPWLLGA